MIFTPWNCAHGEAAPAYLQCANMVALSPADDSVDTNEVIITGQGTITSFGDCPYHVLKRVSFQPSGNITLQNSLSLNLLGKKNRTFSDPSFGIYNCDAQNNWTETYFTAAGTATNFDLEQRLRELEAKVFEA